MREETHTKSRRLIRRRFSLSPVNPFLTPSFDPTAKCVKRFLQELLSVLLVIAALCVIAWLTDPHRPVLPLPPPDVPPSFSQYDNLDYGVPGPSDRLNLVVVRLVLNVNI